MGVKRGEHAQQLLLSQPTELHLVDYWTENNKKDWSEFKKEVEEKFADNPVVKIYDGRVEDVMPTFPNGYFDWIYIDTWHDYQSITRDIELALPLIKKNGLLCGHDFMVFWQEWGRFWKTGVIRGVIEFIQSGRGRMVAISCEQAADWALIVNEAGA